MISLVVPGPPTGKGRHRSSLMRSRTGKAFIHNYQDKKTESAEATIRAIYAQTYGAREPLAGPLTLQVRAFFPMPKSANKAAKEMAARECLPHCKKPDLSNIIKLAEDALNGIAYRDDSTIFKYDDSWKVYSDRPRLEIDIREINDLSPFKPARFGSSEPTKYPANAPGKE